VGEGEDGRGGEEGVDSLGKLKTRIYHTGITVYFFFEYFVLFYSTSQPTGALSYLVNAIQVREFGQRIRSE
jgi:hypothetical protein